MPKKGEGPSLAMKPKWRKRGELLLRCSRTRGEEGHDFKIIEWMSYMHDPQQQQMFRILHFFSTQNSFLVAKSSDV